MRPERNRIGRVVPGHVQADGAVRAGERVERGDVVDLLLGGARLAADGEAAEAGAAGAHRPRGRRDREAGDLVDDRVGRRCRLRPRRSRSMSRSRVVRGDQVRLDLDDLLGGDLRRHRSPPCCRVHRRNAAATPPSTGTISPVVRERSPPVSATTASATCSRQHLLAEQGSARVELAEPLGVDTVRRRPAARAMRR